MKLLKYLVLAGGLLAGSALADFPNPLITCWTTVPNDFTVTKNGSYTAYNFGDYAAKKAANKISNVCYNYSTGDWFDEAPDLIYGNFVAYVPVKEIPLATDSAQYRRIFAIMQMSKASNKRNAVDPINKTIRIQTIRTLFGPTRGHLIWGVDQSNYLGISVDMRDPSVVLQRPAPYNDTSGYAYSPSIVKYNSVYHKFYCSQGAGGIGVGAFGLQDYIRHSTSTDGVNWSFASPIISLKPNVNLAIPAPREGERCACDPSVVYNDDENKWFLFYGGAYNGDGQIYVAKSVSLDGPWQKLIGNAPGSWSDPNDNTSMPLPIITPKYPTMNSNGGAARPTVVFLPDEHKFYMWYSDQSFSPTAADGTKNSVARYFFTKSKSSNGVDWEASQEFQIQSGSSVESAHNFYCDPGEVKWEPLSRKFWLFNRDISPADLQHVYDGPSVITRFKASPEQPWIWSRTDTVATLTNYSSGLGVSGDHHGWIDSTNYFISSSAPWEFNGVKFPYNPASWNIYSIAIRGKFN